MTRHHCQGDTVLVPIPRPALSLPYLLCVSLLALSFPPCPMEPRSLWQPGWNHTLHLRETLPGLATPPAPSSACDPESEDRCRAKLPPAFCSRHLPLSDHRPFSSYTLVFQKILCSSTVSWFILSPERTVWSILSHPLISELKAVSLSRASHMCCRKQNSFPFEYWNVRDMLGGNTAGLWKLPRYVTIFPTCTALHMLFPSFLNCLPITVSSGKYSSCRTPPLLLHVRSSQPSFVSPLHPVYPLVQTNLSEQLAGMSMCNGALRTGSSTQDQVKVQPTSRK